MSLRASATHHAVAYVRVSTDEQASEGVSLDAQADRIRSIVSSLDRDGFKSRAGTPLSLTQIARLVKCA